ncbi:MAG: hypothetical protein J5755_05750 [Clostridia bacterium]|nr:hypothetical protein [Clostridia bacterium]
MEDYIFTGSYTYQIDPKGRMRLPASFRSMLGTHLRIGYGDGKYLVIYTEASVQELREQRKAVDPYSQREQAKLFRDKFSSMKDFECDGQGRYTIPSDFRNELDLKDEIVIAGNDQLVEIWSKYNFEHRDEDDIAYWRFDKKYLEEKPQQ